MDLLNLKVRHKKFGEGVIISNDNDRVIVHFPDIDSDKKFVYPDAFEKFLQIDDRSIKEEAKKDFAQMQEQIREKKEAQKKKEEEAKIKRLEEELLQEFILSNQKKEDKKVAKKSKVPAKKYHNIAIRKELSAVILEEEVAEILKAGKISITYQNKKKEAKQWLEERKGTFGMITCLPLGEPEAERMVSAVFMTDSFQSLEEDGGEIHFSPHYQIVLTKEEMKKIKFWEYYYNPENPAAIEFNGEKYCYFSDSQAAQILLKLYEIKQDEREKQLAGECLDYFCRVKRLDLCKLEKPEGPLA